MRRLFVLVFLLIASKSFAATFTGDGVVVRDEGVAQGRARNLDCVGAGIACTVTPSTSTATVTVGGGSDPDPLIIPGKTVAAAPTAAGSVARLTNGGAIGAQVMGDGTDVNCDLAKTLKWRVITCPPFNADPTNTVAADTAIAAAIAAAGSGGRVAAPIGTFKITSPILIRGLRDFRFIGMGGGNGNDGTRFDWAGNATDSVFNISGVRDSGIADFSIVAGTAAVLHTGILVETDVAGLSTNNQFDNIYADGVSGKMTYGVRIVPGSAGNSNNDLHSFHHLNVLNYSNSAVYIDGTQAKEEKFFNSNLNSGGYGQYGIRANTGAFLAYDTSGGNNSVADFQLGAPNDHIVISGANLEASARLLTNVSDCGGNSFPVLIQNVRWATESLHADNKAVIYKCRGPFTMINNSLQPTGKALEIDISPTAWLGQSTVIGNFIGSTLLDPFTGTFDSVGESFGNLIDRNDGRGMQPLPTRFRRRFFATLGAVIGGSEQQETTLSGSIDPIASTTVTGVGTKFLVELVIGDKIIVSGETRTVTAIASDTSLTVDTAFSDNANDTTLQKVIPILVLKDSAGAQKVIVDDVGKVGIGTNPLVGFDSAKSARITGTGTSVLTGSIDAIASTTVTGVGTLFRIELVVGDRITVTGETRTVTAIASDTSLTVDTAFTDTANDATPDKLAAIFILRTSDGTPKFTVNDLGDIDFRGVLKMGATPSLTGNMRFSNGFNATAHNAANTVDANLIYFGSEMQFGDGNFATNLRGTRVYLYDGLLQFGSGQDTGLSYISPGVIGVGTGALGSFAGTLKGATINATSGFQVAGVALASTDLSDTATITRNAAALVSTAIATGNGATALQTPSATTTLDASGNINTPGTMGSGSGGTVAGETQLYELGANGSNFRSRKVPDALTASLTTTLPDAVPSAGDVEIHGAVSGSANAITYGKPAPSEVDGHTDASLSAYQVTYASVHNTGQAAADVALTLPTAAAGYSAIFTVGTAQANKWGVRAGTNDKIYLIAADGTIATGADNGYARMTNAQVGQAFQCWTFKTDAYDWQCKAIAIGTSTFAAN